MREDEDEDDGDEDEDEDEDEENDEEDEEGEDVEDFDDPDPAKLFDEVSLLDSDQPSLTSASCQAVVIVNARRRQGKYVAMP